MIDTKDLLFLCCCFLHQGSNVSQSYFCLKSLSISKVLKEVKK